MFGCTVGHRTCDMQRIDNIERYLSTLDFGEKYKFIYWLQK